MDTYFLRTPTGCLDHIKDVWTNNGILRVEIIQPHQRAYAEKTGTIDSLFTLTESYYREMKARQMYSAMQRQLYVYRIY